MTGQVRNPSRATIVALLLGALWLAPSAHAADQVNVEGQQVGVAQQQLKDAGWDNVVLDPAEPPAAVDPVLVIVVHQLPIFARSFKGIQGYRLVLGASVPKVTGLSLPAARSTLAQSGLRSGAFTKHAANLDDLLVTAQSPDPGTLQPFSTPVGLTLAPGIRVPTLLGDSVSDAQAAADSAGLQLKVNHKNQEGNLGSVENQDPLPGTLVAANSSVTVTVSVIVGPATTTPSATVPNLAGLTVDQARRRLTAARLTLDAFVNGDATIAKTVRQDPAPGTKVLPGSQVAVRFEVAIPSGDSTSSGSSWPWVLGGIVLAAAAATTMRHAIRAHRDRAWVEQHVTYEGDIGRGPETHVERPGSDVCWSVRLEPHLDAGTQSMEEVFQ